jgi:2-polyprenyl-3-methyl-5-hydroxy-6-metoxy-1,4-benzoquinol methylase
MLKKLSYAFSGLIKRFTTTPKCPVCDIKTARDVIDQKGPYQLFECADCKILYRYPADSETELFNFYQNSYSQAGLTTDLPSEKELQTYLASNFKDTEKDASSIISLLMALGLCSGANVLDYGANWGYTVYQLRNAGICASGYELSVPRGNFAKNLGVEVKSDENSLVGGYHCVFSSHVLEHVSNPLNTIHRQLNLLQDNGWLVGFTPNGSNRRRECDFNGFHKHWNQVHPVLLSAEFLLHNFKQYPLYLSSSREPDSLKNWGGVGTVVEDCSGGELVFAIRKANRSM